MIEEDLQDMKEYLESALKNLKHKSPSYNIILELYERVLKMLEEVDR